LNLWDYWQERQLFRLAYQQEDVKQAIARQRQRLYRALQRRYPQYQEAPTPLGGRIRVGFISPHLYSHSGAAWIRGWLRNLSRDDVQAYCFHLGEKRDRTTEEIKHLSWAFVQLPQVIPAIADFVRNHRLHVLIYPDIGLHPISSRLACLRLAPVQAVGIGHPITSGIPSLDCFLSGDWLESANGQAHYTERLVRLRGLGIPLELPPMPKPDRDFFSLSPRRLVFLCCQNPLKYRPQDDRLYLEIAHRVPNAKFVFLQGPIQRRLPCKFRRDYCHFFPYQRRSLYRSLVASGDIWLDPPGWSGYNGTLEAIAAGLPVVTLPGEQMRSRISAGILRQLGTPTPICTSKVEYLALATDLATNPDKRNAIARSWSNRARHEDYLGEWLEQRF